MNMSRAVNGALAVLYALTAVAMTVNWLNGEPASWVVWLSAIAYFAILAVKCIRDAILGVWA